MNYDDPRMTQRRILVLKDGTKRDAYGLINLDEVEGWASFEGRYDWESVRLDDIEGLFSETGEELKIL